ncbi:MAG: hypothetical protein ACRD10_09645, partial [Terriglobia bacterium]
MDLRTLRAGGLLETATLQRREPAGCESRFKMMARGVLPLCASIAVGALLLCGARARGGQQNPGMTPQMAVPFVTPPAPAQSGPPLTISLQDAIKRAQENSPAFRTAVTDYLLARQNRVQANAAQLPSVDYTTHLLNTTGNGLPTGRFVTNDGVQVYR